MDEMERMEEEALGILKKYWGYGTFREGQADAVLSVLGRCDTLALMPTGAGKSILYQVPALMREGVCLVVSPLVSLMKDQVDRLRSRGIPAAAIHSALSTRQIDLVLDNAAWGDLKFLYVSPERLESTAFRERITKVNVSLLAVDEAHCISQWGYDFRPAYLRIGELRRVLGDVPVVALTASATPDVAADIMDKLQMREGRLIRSSFARPNLSYAVRHTNDKQDYLLRVINNVAGTGIVYVRTRSMTENLSQWLAEKGVSAEGYHAGMAHHDRAGRQERWLKGQTRVIVATNAFGMGIDKPDVRFVVHYDICDSIEAYYQEAGRAGRDGRRSYAVLLTSPDDTGKSEKRLGVEYPSIENIRKSYEALFNYLQLGIGDGRYLSFAFNVHEFAKRIGSAANVTVNMLKILQYNGYLYLSDETDNPPRIQFIVERDDLYKIRIDREELDHIIRTVLRLYAGLFGGRFIPIDTDEIAHYSGYTVDRVRELLKKLWELRIIKYIPGGRSPILTLTEERLPARDVVISPETYALRKECEARRLEKMFGYTLPGVKCRASYIREYFGEEQPGECGFCDLCLDRKKRERNGTDTDDAAEVAGKLEKHLRDNGPLSVKEAVALFRCTPEEIIAVIDKLKQSGSIRSLDNGKIDIKK